MTRDDAIVLLNQLGEYEIADLLIADAEAIEAAREALGMSEHDLTNRIGRIETLEAVRAALALLDAREGKP